MASRSLQSELVYLTRLAAAGLDGIASARRETQGSVPAPRPSALLWTPAMGGAIGVLGARWLGKRKSAPSMAMGSLLGSICGYAAALAWASRGLIVPAARGAARHVNSARDARWLELNPINYA